MKTKATTLEKDTAAEADRIARELGHDSFQAAPPTVRRNIRDSLPDGATVANGDLWDAAFEELAEHVR